MKLLLDIGNSRLKWALSDGRALVPGGAYAHAVFDRVEDVVALWKDIDRVDAAWAASVGAPTLDATLAQAVRSRFGIELRFAHSVGCVCGVRSAYAQPERLGIDRFLGLIALHAQGLGPAVLVGCGTALTLDALAADGSHLGGLIAPSPGLMREALLGKTARLGELGAARVVEFADSTADAVESGTWLAAASLVERFIGRAARRFDAEPTLVLSGGSATQLAALLTASSRIEGDLVLYGLAVFTERGSRVSDRIAPP